MSEERLLTTFLDLVRIDSPTGREAGVAMYCRTVLEECGFDVHEDGSAAATGSDTGNLVCTLPGTVSGRCVVLSSHMDCVQPCEGVRPVVEDGVVRSAGDTVLGADCKAGLAAILESCRRLSETGRPHADIRVVLTVAEETGLRGAKALAAADVAGDLALVPDADGEVGGIAIASPTHYTFVAQFTGKAAHAGVEPERGSSAVLMAARAVSAMRLGRLDEETTANVGTIEGGTATNVIAERVRMTGECRSIDRSKVEEVRAAMTEVMEQAAAALGGRVDVAWTREYESFRFAEDDPVVELAREACRRAGVEPNTFATGGGSDGNVLAALGVPTLVLASGMGSVHGTSEHIPVAELERLAALVGAVLDLAAEA